MVELAGRLQSYGTLYWVKLAGGATGSAIVLHSYSPQNSREVARLLELLAIRKPERDGDDVIIPVQLSAGSPSPNTISLETRSLLDLMRLAAASIELPPTPPARPASRRRVRRRMAFAYARRNSTRQRAGYPPSIGAVGTTSTTTTTRANSGSKRCNCSRAPSRRKARAWHPC